MGSDSIHFHCSKCCGATLAILSEVCVLCVMFYFINGNAEAISKHQVLIGVLAALGIPAIPLFGWLGDCIIGRCKAVECSLLVLWVLTILYGIAEVLMNYFGVDRASELSEIILLVLSVLVVIVVAFFIVNNFHFGIDQLEEAPSWRISSYISWYCCGYYMSIVIKSLAFECTSKYVSLGVAALMITVTLCLFPLFKNSLVVIPRSPNSLRLIFGVLKYAMKHKYPHLRSAYSFWQEKKSRINLAKSIYGGPFASDEVEAVKTFLKMLVVIPLTSFLPELFLVFEVFSRSSIMFHYSDSKYVLQGSVEYRHHYLRTLVYNISAYFIVIEVILYETLLYPRLKKYISSLTISKKIKAGALLLILTWLAFLTLELVGHVKARQENRNVVCLFNTSESTFKKGESMNVSFYWLCVPKFFNSIGFYLLFSSGMELLCAQSPASMKSLLVGITWSMLVVSVAGSQLLKYLFSLIGDREPLSCGIYYFFFASFVSAITVLVYFLIYAWYGKRRRRDNMEEEVEEVGVHCQYQVNDEY